MILQGSPYAKALAVDPNAPDTLYAATMDGMLRSGDAGRTWAAIGGELSTSFLRLIVVSSNGTLYATVQNRGLFATVDGGRSWTRTLPGELNEPLAVAVDPYDATTIYAGMFRGLSKTTDAGAEWRRVCPLGK
jgi:photosystem II stability/assembly factor-like uncharacterized protein